MRFLTRNLLIGFGAGAAVTLLVLNIWGMHYSSEYLFSLQPRLLRPELQQHLEEYISSQPNARLPEPWLPGISSAPHDGWQLKSLAGKPLALGDFKGKVVFLDIWATWCGPCVNQMAGIKRLADSLKNENVAFLLAARDTEPELHKFLSQHPIDLPIYLASGAAPDMPDAPIPVNYILDRKGAVVSQHIGAASWDTDSVRAFLRSLENR